MNILDFKRKIQIVGSFKEVSKSYTEGIYADTPANRKLGRVGMSYIAYAEKLKNNSKKEETEEKKKGDLSNIQSLDIDSLSIEEVRKLFTSKNIKEILSVGEDNKLYINKDYRKGNNWNSTIDGIYKYKDTVYLDVYIQSTKTDWNDSVALSTFLSKGSSSIHSRSYTCTYNETDKINVLKSILKQYKYTTSDEGKEAKNKQQILDKLKNHSICNPVLDSHYRWHMSDKELKEYHAGQKRMYKYIENNYKDLNGKTEEELKKLYNQAFEGKIR